MNDVNQKDPGRERPSTMDQDPRRLRSRAVECQRNGRHREAISLYRSFLTFSPNDAHAWSNLGVAHRSVREFDAAVGCYHRALELKPDDAGFLSNLGNALKDLDRLEEAVEVHGRAARLAPADYNTRHNFGITLREAGRFDEALREFDVAAAIAPDNPAPRWDSAVTYLSKGDFSNGWRAYEWRWKLGELKRPEAALPEWRGEACIGKTLYFYAEQGFGDTLLAVRFLPWVKSRGARVYLECGAPLRRLFSKLEGVDALIAPEDGVPADTDLIAPLMSLPGLFGASTANLPPPPALYIPPSAHSRAARLIGQDNGRFRVGVVWSGSVTFRRNHKRSVSVERFIPLSHMPGVQLFSLQKGPREGDLRQAGAASLMIDLGSRVADFAETAACVAALDLVIMTDSSVAHLCGCLGRPVWNLLDNFPYWLYLTGREDTPWYPSMRLYRQPAAGDWDSVFRRVHSDLRRLVESSRRE